MRTILALLLASAAWGQGTVIPTNTWVNPSQTNSISGMSNIGYQGSVYDPSTKLHCSWGSFVAVFSEWQNAMLCYSVAANRLFPLVANHASPTPHWGQAGHQNGGVVYVPGKGLIAYTGDGSGSLTASSSMFGHLWTFDTAGMTGRDISTLLRPWLIGTPAGGWGYSNSAGKVVMTPAATPGVYKTAEYTPSTNSFSLQSDGGLGQIGNINLRENVDDPGVLYMYDGTNIKTYTISTHTWSSYLTTTCTGGTCTSGHPPTRVGGFMAYSSVDHLFVMGGGNAGSFGGTAYSDTWTYNPSTLAWSLLSVSGSYPTNAGNTNWDTLTYDVDSNLFVLMPRANNGTAITLFALSTPLAYGRAPVTPTVTSGQLNRGTAGTTWATEPAIMANGTDIYIGHQESCPGCTTAFPHAYVSTTPNTGAFTNLPAGAQTSVYAAIDSEGTGSANTYTGKIRLAHIGGAPWVLSEKFGGGLALTAIAKSWTGSAWSGGLIGCFVNTCTSGGNYSQQGWGIVGVGTVPHVVTTEYDATNGQSKLVVAKYTGSWAQVGSTLNVGGTSVATGSRALSASIATDGSNPSVCWAEEVINGSDRSAGASVSSQLYCKTWNGSAWGTQWTGAGLNIGASTTTSFANDPAMVYTGGNYYVAWTERTTTGVNKLYAGVWNGSTFTQLGSALNIDTSTGWAFRPRLATDGTYVYLSWEEQQNVGQHVLGYVKRWSIAGAAWSQVGGAIAADATNGSVEGVDIAMVGSAPTVVFSELNYASVRSIYTRQYSAGSWHALGCTAAIFPLPSGFQGCH